LGEVSEVDLEKIIPDPKKSIKKGGFAPLGEYKRTWIFDKLDAFLIQEGFLQRTPRGREVTAKAYTHLGRLAGLSNKPNLFSE
jgi:excinuclease UvrABC ATPase subunit